MHDDFLYGREFCSQREKHRQWQRTVGYNFAELLDVYSVVDFGCSIASFLEGFYSVDCKIQGFELGYEFSKEYTPKHILPFINFGDVTEFIDCDIAECSMSIEVAEHIPTGGSDMFVKNLCEHSSKYIILSAAPLEQGGVGHINCQPSFFWISKILEYDFVLDKSLNEKMMKMILEIKGVPTWIKTNLMIFEKK